MAIQDQLPDTELAQSLKEDDFLEKHLTQLIIGVVGFLVVFGVIIMLRSSSLDDNQEAWGRFESATTPEEFDSIADDFPGNDVAAWSRLMSGEQLLGESVRLMFTDREAAKTQLEAAEEKFDTVIEKNYTGNLSQVAARAYLGKARVMELTLGGDVEDTIAAYKELDKPEYENLGYKSLIEDRIEALGKRSTKEFYAWFDKQSPKPTDRPAPFDGLPPNHPSMTPVSLPPIPPELYPAEWSELDADEGPLFEPPKSLDGDDTTTKDVDSATKKADDAKTDGADATKTDDAKATGTDATKTDDAKKADDTKTPAPTKTPEAK
jgi:hypothetical protein